MISNASKGSIVNAHCLAVNTESLTAGLEDMSAGGRSMGGLRRVRFASLGILRVAASASVVVLTACISAQDQGATPLDTTQSALLAVPQGVQTDSAYAASAAGAHVSNIFATAQQTSCFTPELSANQIAPTG